MPFTSKKQQKYMFAAHPKIAKEMASGMTKKDFKKLPAKAKKKK